MREILKLVRIQVIFLVLFAFFKQIRGSVIEQHPPEWVKIPLYSLPNFFEAVVGTLVIAGIGILFNLRILQKDKRIKRSTITIISPVLAGVYVISQELNLHSIGGNNTYDKNDILFSVMGLIVAYGILKKIEISLPLND